VTPNHRGDGAGEMGDNLPAIDLGSGRTATAVAAGWAHVCARLDNGQVKVLGQQHLGELGLGDAIPRGNAPGEMGDNLPGCRLADRADRHRRGAWRRAHLRVARQWQVRCFGANTHGQLGLGDTNHRGDGPGELGDNLAAVALGSGRTATRLALGDASTVRLARTTARSNAGVSMTRRSSAWVTSSTAASCPVRWATVYRESRSAPGGARPSSRSAESTPARCSTTGWSSAGATTPRGSWASAMCWLGATDLARWATVYRRSTSAPGEAPRPSLVASAIPARGSTPAGSKCWGDNFFGQLGQGNTNEGPRGDTPGELGDILLPIVFF